MQSSLLSRSLLVFCLILPGCASGRLPGIAGTWQRDPTKEGEPWIHLKDAAIELKRDQLSAAVAMLMEHPMIELTQSQAAQFADEKLRTGGSDHWMLVRALGRPEQGFRHHIFTTPDGLELWISGTVAEHAPKEPALYALIISTARVPRREYVSVAEGQ